MSDLREVNLRDLRRRFFDPAGQIAEARSVFASRPDLARLLRDHEEDDRGISDPVEIRLRDGFDDWLAFVARLEVAAQARMIPDELPADLGDEMARFLEHRDVRRYYEEHYPLKLPALFRQRLTGRNQAQVAVQQSRAAASLFSAFLDVNGLLEGDEDVETFLWFLDDGSYGTADMTRLDRLMRDPERFLETLMGQSSDPLARAARGFRQFVIFCTALDTLLQRAREIPLLATAFRDYHGYWFTRMGKRLGDSVERSLEQFSNWPGSEETAASRQELVAIVRRLTS